MKSYSTNSPKMVGNIQDLSIKQMHKPSSTICDRISLTGCTVLLALLKS